MNHLQSRGRRWRGRLGLMALPLLLAACSAITAPGVDSVTVSPDGRNVYAASGTGQSVAVFARNQATGALRQLAGAAGCVAHTTKDGCARVRGLYAATHVAESPGGRNVYVTSSYTSPHDHGPLAAIAVLDRNHRTGVLTQRRGASGCLTATASEGCARLRGLTEATWMTTSPDGKNAYAVSGNHAFTCTFGQTPSGPGIVCSDVPARRAGAIAVFSRNVGTGALRQLRGTAGCINADGADGCAVGRELKQAISVSVSPDGANVYTGTFAAAERHGIAAFSRNPATGALSQLPGTQGCINTDGSQGCTAARGIRQPLMVALSPRGDQAYVAQGLGGGIATFSRDRATGALSQLPGAQGCITADPVEGCTPGHDFGQVSVLAVTPDGRNVYAPDPISDGVTVLARDGAGGSLSQLGGNAGCVGHGGDFCSKHSFLIEPLSVAISSDGLSIYLAGDQTNVIGVFRRNPTSGTLQQLMGRAGCIQGPVSRYRQVIGSCARGRGFGRVGL
jgi:6-phosphogluconolactonase (cycloisomerase 2 family)